MTLTDLPNTLLLSSRSSPHRKSTFDMFNFLASQHRQPPDMVAPCDEEDDDFPLKSSR